VPCSDAAPLVAQLLSQNMCCQASARLWLPACNKCDVTTDMLSIGYSKASCAKRHLSGNTRPHHLL